jgi:hypothetical protein
MRWNKPVVSVYDARLERVGAARIRSSGAQHFMEWMAVKERSLSCIQALV